MKANESNTFCDFLVLGTPFITPLYIWASPSADQRNNAKPDAAFACERAEHKQNRNELIKTLLRSATSGHKFNRLPLKKKKILQFRGHSQKCKPLSWEAYKTSDPTERTSANAHGPNKLNTSCYQLICVRPHSKCRENPQTKPRWELEGNVSCWDRSPGWILPVLRLPITLRVSTHSRMRIRTVSTTRP